MQHTYSILNILSEHMASPSPDFQGMEGELAGAVISAIVLCDSDHMGEIATAITAEHPMYGFVKTLQSVMLKAKPKKAVEMVIEPHAESESNSDSSCCELNQATSFVLLKGSRLAGFDPVSKHQCMQSAFQEAIDTGDRSPTLLLPL